MFAIKHLSKLITGSNYSHLLDSEGCLHPLTKGYKKIEGSNIKMVETYIEGHYYTLVDNGDSIDVYLGYNFICKICDLKLLDNSYGIIDGYIFTYNSNTIKLYDLVNNCLVYSIKGNYEDIDLSEYYFYFYRNDIVSVYNYQTGKVVEYYHSTTPPCITFDKILVTSDSSFNEWEIESSENIVRVFDHRFESDIKEHKYYNDYLLTRIGNTIKITTDDNKILLNYKSNDYIIDWHIQDNLLYIHTERRIKIINIYNGGEINRVILSHKEVISFDNYFLLGCDDDRFILYNLSKDIIDIESDTDNIIKVNNNYFITQKGSETLLINVGNKNIKEITLDGDYTDFKMLKSAMLCVADDNLKVINIKTGEDILKVKGKLY